MITHLSALPRQLFTFFTNRGWTVLNLAIAGLISIPVLVVLSNIFFDAADIWQHLAATVLPRYLLNSLWLTLGVGAGALILGVGTAWLVTMCRFPGSRLFEWALLLPLAAPAYVLAYAYTGFLDVTGPVQSWLRQQFDWGVGDYWFPDIRSVEGAIALLILVLYPYVYLLARVAFLEQSVCTLEASRSLGLGPWGSFARVALPLARPAIAAGLALVLMETLSDFGTVQYFGVDTFTTGIYRTWFGLGERVAAAQLSALLLLLIFWLIFLERWSRRQARYYQTSNRYRRAASYSLGGVRAGAACLACSIPIIFGSAIPAALLLQMTLNYSDSQELGSSFWSYASHSLTLGALTAALAVLIAMILAYGVRLNSSPAMQVAARIAAMGYAVPGAVIAVGVLIPVGWLDNQIDDWSRATFGVSTGLLLSGTITALVFAYLVRFLAVSFGAVEASLTKIKVSLDDSARSLGHGPTSVLVRVHAPLIWSGLLTAAMLVFVDVTKELPATLIIRPFNYDTLAVRAYQLASDERLAEAAAPALAIVVVGMLPVILLSLRVTRYRSFQKTADSPQPTSNRPHPLT